MNYAGGFVSCLHTLKATCRDQQSTTRTVYFESSYTCHTVLRWMEPRLQAHFIRAGLRDEICGLLAPSQRDRSCASTFSSIPMNVVCVSYHCLTFRGSIVCVPRKRPQRRCTISLDPERVYDSFTSPLLNRTIHARTALCVCECMRSSVQHTCLQALRGLVHVEYHIPNMSTTAHSHEPCTRLDSR